MEFADTGRWKKSRIASSTSSEERVKEWTAFHRAVRLMQDSARPMEDVLNDIVALLPPAWQYPEITAARIVFDGVAYATVKFSDTRWKQSAH